MEANVAWFVLAPRKRQVFGPFFSPEDAEEEAYRVGGTEIEERHAIDVCSEARIELAIIRPFALCKAECRTDCA